MYFMILPNFSIAFEILPTPTPIPIMAAAKGKPNPKAKVISMSMPQSILPFKKDAASTTGKMGLQHMLKAQDNPPTRNPKTIADKMLPESFFCFIDIPGMLMGNKSME